MSDLIGDAKVHVYVVTYDAGMMPERDRDVIAVFASEASAMVYVANANKSITDRGGPALYDYETCSFWP